MEPLGIQVTINTNATNNQIVQTVVGMLPIANKQMQGYSTDGTPLQILAKAQALPKSLGIQYKADGWNQKVQLPSSLINTKVGDCKSFSLLIAGYLTANRIANGIVFVGYGTNHVSHVYNYAIVNGKTYWIDGTIPASTIPANRAKETIVKKFMNLEVVAAPYDLDEGVGRRSKAERKKRKAERKENRKEKREERGSLFKRASLAPGRAAMLSLLIVNPNGLANRTLRAIKQNEQTVKRFWNRLGGNFDKFKQAAERGAKRKKVNGAVGEAYPGVGFTELISVAAKLLKGLFALFQGMKVPKEKDEDFETLIPKDTPELGADLEVEDPEAGSNYEGERNKQKKGAAPKTEDSGGFQPSTTTIMLGVGLLGLLVASK